MKKNEKRLFTLSCAAALLFAVPSSASAMHIMEGYLPIGHAVAWGALCLPFLAAGLISIKRTVAQHRKALLILAMAGAYAFVLSALKIPSVTGSSWRLFAAKAQQSRAPLSDRVEDRAKNLSNICWTRPPRYRSNMEPEASAHRTV